MIFANIFIFALINACLAVFVVFCLQEGNIFGFYGAYLGRISENNKKIFFMLKPLGGCHYCLSTWTYLVGVFIFFIDDFSKIDMLYIYGTGVNYTTISILDKLEI